MVHVRVDIHTGRREERRQCSFNKIYQERHYFQCNEQYQDWLKTLQPGLFTKNDGLFVPSESCLNNFTIGRHKLQPVARKPHKSGLSLLVRYGAPVAQHSLILTDAIYCLKVCTWPENIFFEEEKPQRHKDHKDFNLSLCPLCLCGSLLFLL